jgi:tRNA threonylcarbamoyladenosine biosynthesis protein TsaE
MKVESLSAEDTFRFAKDLGEKAEAGDIFLLKGDLGTGKTGVAQGIASGLGISEPVNSPTFTILQVYETGRLPLYHFDVYRIEEPEEMEEVGLQEYLYGDGVAVLEWPERIDSLLQGRFTEICILKNIEKGFNYREITVETVEL